MSDQALKSTHDVMDVKDISRFLARRWTFIVGITAATTIAGFAACVLMTPRYNAVSQVLLDPPKQTALAKEAASGSGTLDSSLVDSQIPLILSNRTLAKVAAEALANDDSEFSVAIRPGLLTRVVTAARSGLLNIPAQAPADGDSRKTSQILLLTQATDVARVAKSNALSITVSSRDAKKAARLANLIAETYVGNQVADRVQAIQQTAGLFEERLRTLREQVRASENAVSDFRRKNGLGTTSDEKVTVSDQQITNLNEKLATADSQAASKLAKYDQARRMVRGRGDPSTLVDVVQSPVIGQLRGQQADVARREADLLQIYGPAHPAVREIAAQRIAIDSAMSAEMSRLLASLKNDYDVAASQQADLRTAIAKLGNSSDARGNIGVQLRDLERTNAANKALFESFLNKSKLADEQPSFEVPDARVISPAMEPLQPSSPRSNVIIPIAAIAGLVLALGLAAALDALNRYRGTSAGMGSIPRKRQGMSGVPTDAAKSTPLST